MVNAPHTYSEWTKILRSFAAKENDAEVIPAMKAGTLEWQSGVADRFSKHLTNALNKRIDLALDKFESDMSHATDVEEGYVKALNALTREYATARDAADLPCIPEEFRVLFIGLVEDSASRAQQSLEDSAATIDRSGRVLSIVRSHAVTRFEGA